MEIASRTLASRLLHSFFMARPTSFIFSSRAAAIFAAAIASSMFIAESARADAGAPACSAEELAACSGLSTGAFCTLEGDTIGKCSTSECPADADAGDGGSTLRCIAALSCESGDVRACDGRERGATCGDGRCTELSICVERDGGTIGERAVLVCAQGFHISDLGDDQQRERWEGNPERPKQEDSGCLMSPKRGASTFVAPSVALALGLLFRARTRLRRKR